MLIRDSGVIQLFAENAQEAYDLTVMAPRLAEHPDVLLPVLVCQDGFTITHSAEPVDVPRRTTRCARFVGEYRIPYPLLDVAPADDAGPVRDARLLLRAPAPAGGRDGGGAAACSSEVGGEFDGSPAAATSSVERLPARRTPSARSSPRLDGREREGRRRRAARRGRAGRARSRSARSGRSRRGAIARCARGRRRGRACSTAPTRPAARRRSSPRSPPRSTAAARALARYVYGLGGRDLHPEPTCATIFAGATLAQYVGLRGAAVSRLKTLVRNENGTPPLRGGHSLCQGCGIPMVVRTVRRLDRDARSSSSTRPAASRSRRRATRPPPGTCPWLHVAFENAAAVASGVETRLPRARAGAARLPQDEEITFVVFAGDGGTYDIGLQALSGALERGHRFVFVCYDNEAYMNTGIQRSGATPFGAATTTSPAGHESARQGAAAQGHDRDRGRAPHPLRRAGRRRRTGTT